REAERRGTRRSGRFSGVSGTPTGEEMKLSIGLLAIGTLYAQVTYERLLQAPSEPNNWLTYSGSYRGWRHSALDQITRANVGNLRVAWVKQMPTSHRIEATPIVVDGIMYVSEPPSNVFALAPSPAVLTS